MSYRILSIPFFDKQFKRLFKKYPSLKLELNQLKMILEKDPKSGNLIGKNCYKIRINIASKGKGKSGGARVITNVLIKDEIVYLLTIYDKADQENITDKELEKLLNTIPE